MKPFLILQLRPEDEASDSEYEAFLRAGDLKEKQVHRIQIDREKIPPIDLDQYSGVIVGGGPYCVSDKDKPPEQLRFEKQLKLLLKRIVKDDIPFLGACYGIGILAQVLGAEVSKEKYSEVTGGIDVELTDEGRADPLFSSIPSTFRAFVGHKEACQNIPKNSVRLATSGRCPTQAIKVKNNIYATQFHPELDNIGLILRIDIYRHSGYFQPHQADELIAMAHKEEVTEPERFFRNFVDKYKIA